MIRSKLGKASVACLMALLISNVPHVACAEAAEQMIPTSEFVESLTREQAEAKVREYLERADVQTQLAKLGMSSTEISQRVSNLSAVELNRLAVQMDEARYGGDVVGILLIVFLVLGIIYLAKRI